MKNNNEAVTPTSSNNWGKKIDLPQLSLEGCLPVIGSSQLSSILSTLNTPEKITSAIELPQKSTDVQVSKTNPLLIDNKLNQSKNRKSMKYVLCDLCPFLCLDQSDMKCHLNLLHTTKKSSEVFELKCPACNNIFYHKLSFQSHLLHDHYVANKADIVKISQAALLIQKRVNYVNKLRIDINKTPIIIEGITKKVSVPLPIQCKLETEFVATKAASSDEEDFQEARSDPVGVEEDTVEEILPTPMIVQAVKKNEFEKVNAINKICLKKQFKCTMPNCKVGMQSMENLTYHTKCHNSWTGDSSYQCPESECSETFPLWKSLSLHLWRTHKIDMELYACDQCDYRSHSLSKLNNTHKLTHSDVKSFLCDECDRSFKNAKQLRNHKVRHKKGPNTKAICDICVKSFSNKKQLRVHMDGVHKKLKPFLCNFCAYKSSTRPALRLHLRQHTGEKPFTCDSCEYSTADHNSLRRHKLRHSGDKPYTCLYCPYQCIQSSTYKVHLKTKHPGLDKGILFSCPLCQFRSINKENFTSHMGTTHPGSVI